MSQISIWPLRKTWLSTWWQNPCWQSQRFAHISGGILSHSLQILSKSLRFRGWRLATQTFSSLHRFSMWFSSGDWLGHSRTLMCFFLSHSFVALAVCFVSLSCWNTHPRPIFNALAGLNALALTVHGLVHRLFDAVQLSCSLSRKTPPKHNISTSMFDGGDGVLGVIGSIPPPPNMASWVDAKEMDFGLIWPQHFHPVLLWIIGKLQTGLYMIQDGAEHGSRVASSEKTLQFFRMFYLLFVVLRAGCC